MNKILVLLSTYNGEKFLQEQLDSIRHQTDVDVAILVRDDGSKDSTVEILEENQKTYGNIIIIRGDNVGSARSFLELQEEAIRYEADYYAFCDQDDVWLNDKLISAVKMLSKHPAQDKPTLYMGAYQMVDSNLNILPTRIKEPILSLAPALMSNCATGCTMVFNKSLLCAVQCGSSSDIIMHDYWMYLVCLLREGYVCFDKIPHVLYRQHNNNVIGGLEESFVKRWNNRVKKLFRTGDHFKSKLALKLLNEKGESISNENRQFLIWASSCRKISSKFKILRTKGVLSFSPDKNLQTIGLIITGKF